MNATVQSQSQISPSSIATFEACAMDDGILDSEGFFTQSDSEFQLDTLNPSARAAMEVLLSKPLDDIDTVGFLRETMASTRDVHFEPFKD